MSIFTISDFHLSLSCNKPMDIFGDNWQNHAEKIKNAFSNLVSENDTVIIGGDISWGMTLNDSKEDFIFIENLPGKKIILKGNHDFFWTTEKKMYDFFYQNNINSIKILHNNAYVCENKIICGTRGWIKDFEQKDLDEKLILRETYRLKLSIQEGLKLKGNFPNNEILVFLHYPPILGKFKNNAILNILQEFKIKNVFYGHLHNILHNQNIENEYLGINFTLTSCDFLNFTPILVN